MQLQNLQDDPVIADGHLVRETDSTWFLINVTTTGSDYKIKFATPFEYPFQKSEWELISE